MSSLIHFSLLHGESLCLYCIGTIMQHYREKQTNKDLLHIFFLHYGNTNSTCKKKSYYCLEQRLPSVLQLQTRSLLTSKLSYTQKRFVSDLVVQLGRAPASSLCWMNRHSFYFYCYFSSVPFT